MSIIYRKAKLSDIKAMQILVTPEVESGKILFRSEGDIATNIRSYILAFDKDKLVGFGALHIYSPTLAEVRSLIVKSSNRGKGIGKEIVNNIKKEAKEIGIKEVFTLTYEKRFFENLNFIEIPKSDLPEQKIWADCIKCKHFPICDEIALIIQI